MPEFGFNLIESVSSLATINLDYRHRNFYRVLFLTNMSAQHTYMNVCMRGRVCVYMHVMVFAFGFVNIISVSEPVLFTSP